MHLLGLTPNFQGDIAVLLPAEPGFAWRTGNLILVGPCYRCRTWEAEAEAEAPTCRLALLTSWLRQTRSRKMAHLVKGGSRERLRHEVGAARQGASA